MAGNSNAATEVWYDNRPCDRANPRFRRLVYATLVAVFVPGTLGIYLLFVSAGGSRTTGILVAGLLGGGSGLAAALIPISLEAGAAAGVSFGTQEMAWRIRSGKVRRADYGRVVDVTTTQWRENWSGNAVGEGVCLRYVVWIRGRFGLQTGLWLTPDNRKRLDDAMAYWRKH